jgi:hypothetical protein
MSVYTRREPWPYHMLINKTGLLLGQAKPGAPQLVSSKTQDIAQVAPPDFSYGGTSPQSDRQEPYESLALGMGMRLQDKWQDYRYAQAMGVDLSVWPWCKGPQVSSVIPGTTDAVQGIRTFFELGGRLYAAAGRYVLQKAVGVNTWSVVKDFGASIVILNVTVFTSNFDGVQRAFFALSSGVAQWTSNGSAYTAFATFTALAFIALGREFWWADDINRMRKCDTNADPTNEANYTNLIFRAGDKSAPITNLLQTAAGTMVIAKTDGLYTLDQAGDDHSLFPFLKFAKRVDNGRWAGQFENGLYVSYGKVFFRLNADLSLEEVGPEKLMTNDGPVRGQVTAFCGVGDMFALAGLYNPDTQIAYLMKFGGFVAATQASAFAAAAQGSARVDVWHGSLSHGLPNVVIQALFESSIDAPSGHTQTWMGLSDGSVAYLINPCVPNPAACMAYLFDVGDGWVDLPIWHGGYHASIKSVRHLAVTGTFLDAQDFVTVDYKLDPTLAAWTTLPNVFDSQIYEEFAMPTDAAAVLAAFRVHLQNTAATASPQVSAFAVGHALRPARYMQFECDILCADGLVRRDGVPLRIGRQEIQHLVEQAVDTAGAVAVTLPNESIQQLSFTDYAISQSFDEIGRTWRGSLHVKAVQWSPQTA